MHNLFFSLCTAVFPITLSLLCNLLCGNLGDITRDRLYFRILIGCDAFPVFRGKPTLRGTAVVCRCDFIGRRAASEVLAQAGRES